MRFTKLPVCSSLTLLLAATALAGGAHGQTTAAAPPAQAGANLDAVGGSGEMGSTGQMDLALRLAEVGRKNQDTLLVIAAAKLAAASPAPTGKREPDQRPGAKPADAEAAGPDRDSIIATARQMATASGDAGLIAMAQSLNTTAARGRVGGGAYDRDWLETGRRMTYSRVTFVGGSLAEVSIQGGAHARLNLSVYDQNGNQVCYQRRVGSNQYCSWYPSWTGPFRVEIENVGSYDTEYVMETN